ncbi:MAG: thioredoxin [Candidatus Krumholzibacteria bacterium]|nr:thioredoxin [Candidatus Krumholzibacteria bacterium]
MSSKELEEVSDKDFSRKVARSTRPVVVDFWAPWCEPCHVIDPILRKMVGKYGDQVDFLKMNVDEEKDTPAQYAVRSIPTILFFKEGAIKNQIIGPDSEAAIERAVQDLL